MPTLDLTTATNVLVGRPAKALPKRRMKQISTLLGEIPQVCEAHLPQVFAIGVMETPRNVLFVVIDPDTAVAEVSQRLDAALSALLKRGEHLDLWPVTADHSLIATVREADCLVGWRD